ncbi:hypothetical protein Droror1_Dr00018559 [Drosera rotundifolia]
MQDTIEEPKSVPPFSKKVTLSPKRNHKPNEHHSPQSHASNSSTPTPIELHYKTSFDNLPKPQSVQTGPVSPHSNHANPRAQGSSRIKPPWAITPRTNKVPKQNEPATLSLLFDSHGNKEEIVRDLGFGVGKSKRNMRESEISWCC